MTRVLFGRVFGIGNAVMSVPAIKHYRDTPGFEVTVVVGTTPDDAGALDVLRMLQGVRVVTDAELMEHVTAWSRHSGEMYPRFDHGVLSIPHDGRWGQLFPHICERVWDGRTRPDPSTTGFVSWERHEALYQLEVAEQVTGRQRQPGPIDPSFYDHPVHQSKTVYLGVGYKRDVAGFWARKHWGDDNFVRFAELVLQRGDSYGVMVTGNADDMRSIGRRLAALSPRVSVGMPPLGASISAVSQVGSYVGNDTGMMHVAASMGKPVVGIFNFEGTIQKNHPLCPNWSAMVGYGPDGPPTPRMVYDTWSEMMEGACRESS